MDFEAPNIDQVNTDELAEQFKMLDKLLSDYFDRVAEEKKASRDNLALQIIAINDEELGKMQIKYFVLCKNKKYWLSNGKEGKLLPVETSFAKIVNLYGASIMEGQIKKQMEKMLTEYAGEKGLNPYDLCLYITAIDMNKYILHKGEEIEKMDYKTIINQIKKAKQMATLQ